MNDKSPAISLIMPIYNVKKYLKEALDSVVNQTFKDFEVLIINDGSTDGSDEIAKRYVKEHKNFRFINQVHVGAGPARNLGIENAKGEYIAFLDSDDYLSKNYLEILYNNAVKTGADISYCNFTFYFENSGYKLYMPLTARNCVLSGEVALKKLMLDVKIHHFPWNKLCKRSLFIDNNVYFSNIYFEDIAVSPQIFYYSKKVVITSKSLYYYRRRSGSISSSIDAKKLNDLISALNITKNFFIKNNVYDKYKKRFNIYLNIIRFLSLQFIFSIHAFNFNFKGLIDNCKNLDMMINFIVDSKYTESLPVYIVQPENRKSKN